MFTKEHTNHTQINDGQADLSRRIMPYDMPGLSLREFLHLDLGLDIKLASAGHKVEYAGYKSGDFRIDGNTVIEVGGADKGFSQLAGQDHSFVAADDIDSAYFRKIPLWAFGFLY